MKVFRGGGDRVVPRKVYVDMGKGRQALDATGGKARGIPVTTEPAKPVFRADYFMPHDFKSSMSTLNPNFHRPLVVIGPNAYLDMYYITGYAGHNEVGWLGTVKRKGDSLFIEEIFLFEQEVTSSSTELSPGHIAQIATKLIQEGQLDKVNALKFWGHVHPGNSTSPSREDEDTMGLLADGNEWFLRGIFGRSGRIEFTLFDYIGHVRFNDVPWQIVPAETEERKGVLAELISRLIHPKSYAGFHSHYMDEGLSAETGFAAGVGVACANPQGPTRRVFSRRELGPDEEIPGNNEE